MVREGCRVSRAHLLFSFWLTSTLAVVSVSSEGQGASLVVAGRGFSLFVDPVAGTVQSTGSNAYGQLGINSTEDQSSPTAVPMPGDEKVVGAAAGAFHSLFLTESGKVYATGRNDHGQLGDGTNADRQLPTLVASNVAAVAAGYAHSLFLLMDGTVMATGLNNVGQLGMESGDLNSPGLVAFGDHGEENAFCDGNHTAIVSAIAAGYDFSYFLLADAGTEAECHGNVYATGQGLGGQLGNGDRQSSTMPVKVSLSGVQALAAGQAHGLFLSTTGALYGVGANFDGQLGGGDGAATALAVPTVLAAAAAEGAFAGGDSSCYTDAVGGETPFVLGSNRQGQLGLGSEAPRVLREPTPLEQGEDVLREAALGESHALYLVGDAVLAAGSNGEGQLGDGSTQNSSSLVQVVEFMTTTSTGTTTAPSATGTETATTSTAQGESTLTQTQTGGHGHPHETTTTSTGTRGTLAAAGPNYVAIGIWLGFLVLCSVSLLYTHFRGPGEEVGETDTANQEHMGMMMTHSS